MDNCFLSEKETLIGAMQYIQWTPYLIRKRFNSQQQALLAGVSFLPIPDASHAFLKDSDANMHVLVSISPLLQIYAGGVPGFP